MKLQFIRRASKYSLTEWLLFLPLAVCLGRLILPEAPLLAWTVSLLAVRVLAIVSCMLFRRTGWLVLSGIFLSSVGPIILYPSFLYSVYLLIVPLALCGFISFWRTVQIIGLGAMDYPPPLYVIGLITYFGFYFLCHYQPMFRPFLPAMTFTGTVSLILSLYQINRNRLREVSFSEQERPDVDDTVLTRNRMYVGGLFAAIFLVSMVGTLRNAFVELWSRIFAYHHGFLTNTKIPQNTPGRPNLPKLRLPKTKTSPHHSSDYLIQVIGFILLAALAVCVLYLAAKFIRKGFHRLFTYLSRKFDRPSSLGYVDESESLHVWRERMELLRRRLRTKKPVRADQQWKDIQSNREKVRFLYRHVISAARRKGFDWSNTLTPLETEQGLAQATPSIERSDLHRFLSVYNGVRYGQEEPADDQVDQFHQRLL